MATVATVPQAPAAPKAKKEERKVFFPDAESAVAEAHSRVKGPRRAFKCTLNGKTLFIVHANNHHAGGIAYEQAGGTVEELGRTTARRAIGVDGIMAAVNGLPEAERKAVMEQLKALMGAKK